VAWTNYERLHWKNKGRQWFFIPGWASSMQDLVNWSPKWHTNKQVAISSDQEDLLSLLSDQHKFFVDFYFGDYQYHAQQTKNYSEALKSFATDHNLRLIELSAFAKIGYCFDAHGAWRREGRHPSAQEHLAIAQEIREKFYQE
jgi:hypothetical protein